MKMDKEHTKYLFETYPFFGYENWKNDPQRLRYTLMPFGFECSDGWFDLIDTLCKEITYIFDDVKWNIKFKDKEAYERGDYIKVEDIRVLQVKEKFGGLRFYTGGIPVEVAEKVYAAISMAESMSYVICEECGCPGKLREDRSWLLTLCDACNEKDKHPITQKANTEGL
jgi:hypothetical protein